MNYFSTLSAKREMLRHSPSPVHFAWERVPDRAGEGSLTQIQAQEPMAKSPHPAFGHLLPPAAGEGTFARREISQ
jgi:hypothetical protein